MTKAKETQATETKTVETNNAPTFKVKKNITLPLIKPQLDVPVYVKVTSAVFEGKKIEGTGDKAKMEPAHLFNCINLETGEEAQMIAPAVLMGIFTDEYENDAYVGKGFRIIKHPKASGKRYHAFSVAELDL